MAHIILGPPGTGKTTRMLNIVESYLERGVDPAKIGFFSFTRKAANEAADRAYSRFQISQDDMPYVRTLYSLAFRQLGVSRNQRMEKEDYAEIAKTLRIPHFTGFRLASSSESSPMGGDLGRDDKFLGLLMMARITGRPLEYLYRNSDLRFSVDYRIIQSVEKAVQSYKRDTGKFDFTDLLERAVDLEAAPRLEALFIDEAQDLSRLQWRYVDILASRAKNTYIAGDDDQAIYGWAGADVDRFVCMEGDVEILGQSHRIPAIHHAMSQKLVGRIFNRRPKDFRPRDELGVLKHHHSPDSNSLDFSEGSWLLLARTNPYAYELEQSIRRRGLLYTRTGAGRASHSEFVQDVLTWERLRKGEEVRISEVSQMYKRITAIRLRTRGDKAALGRAEEEAENRRLDMKDLREEFGVSEELSNMPWYEALDKIPAEHADYLKLCLRKGEQLDEKPRITVSTIHAAKGGEADKVVLMTDDVGKGIQRQRTAPGQMEDEMRIWYVALTRAKKELHMLNEQHVRAPSFLPFR